LLVEFALVVPVLVLLALGVVEYGLAWQDKLTVQTGVRTGIRVGSSGGALASTDQDVLLGIGSAVDSLRLSSVDWVMVYKPSAPDGTVPAACSTPTPHSVSGTCNTYSGAQLQQVLSGTAPASWFGCGGSALDRFWCPTSRQAFQSVGPDQLGVWVRATHNMLSGMFGPTVTVEDTAVMRLEPNEG
jgi:hypothetical protein